MVQWYAVRALSGPYLVRTWERWEWSDDIGRAWLVPTWAEAENLSAAVGRARLAYPVEVRRAEGQQAIGG